MAEHVQDLMGHQGPVNIASYNIDGSYLLSGGSDRTIRLWNPVTGLLVKTFSGHGKEVLGMGIASNNDRFTSGGGDRLVFLWDVASGQIIRRFSGHHHRINDVQLNGESTVIVSASYDATVRLWDCRSQSRFPIQVLDHAKDSVSSVKLTNTEIVTGSIDGFIRIYDIRMGAMISDKIEIPVTCISLSQDGNCILASTLDSTIRLFDKENGSCLNEFKGHVNKNYKLTSCLTKSEEKVLGGSEDGKIFTWDLVQGNVTQIIAAHDKAVSSVVYHPKEEMFTSTCIDGSIKVWSF